MKRNNSEEVYVSPPYIVHEQGFLNPGLEWRWWGGGIRTATAKSISVLI
jgi:hypothetical protein